MLTPGTKANLTTATSEGRKYSINVEFNLPSNGTESPIAILTNPGGSGKIFYFNRITADITTKGNQAVFRVYAVPTVTANGTALSVGNDFVGGAGLPATVATAFSGPTVSANGARARTFSVGANTNSLIIDIENAIAVEAGVTLLLTGTPSANNTGVAISVSWLEL